LSSIPENTASTISLPTGLLDTTSSFPLDMLCFVVLFQLTHTLQQQRINYHSICLKCFNSNLNVGILSTYNSNLFACSDIIYIHVWCLYVKQEGHDGPEVAHLYIGPPGAGPV
jgi:hypothetical protein